MRRSISIATFAVIAPLLIRSEMTVPGQTADLEKKNLDVIRRVQNNREDEEAIKRVITGMTEAFNRHEANVSLLTRDADFVYADGNWLKGAAEIERGRKARFETALKEARLKLLDVRIRFIKPDVALAHVTNEISGVRGLDGQELPASQELNLRVLVKENGKWLLTAFHNTVIRR